MYFTDIFTNISWTTIAFGILIFIVLLFYVRKDFHGPYGLPYFGLFFFMRNDFHLQLMKMTKRYGDVFCFRVAGELYVHLGTAEAIREAHVRKVECFPSRLRKFSIFDLLSGPSFVIQEEEKWKVQRKFFIQALRELSNRDALSDPIQNAVSQTIEAVRKSEGDSINLFSLLSDPCTEAAAQIYFSDIDKTFIKKLTDAYSQTMSVLTIDMFILTGPLLEYFLAPWFSRYKIIRDGRDKMLTLLNQIIAKREVAVRAGNMENNVVDRYLQEKISRQQKGDPQAEFFTETSLASSLIPMFGDATVGMASFIASLLGDLANKTDIQQKMRKEIIQELENKDFPLWEDRIKLPYVNAVIKELMRCNTSFPIIPSNECSCETTVGGIRVPVGCITVPNFWAANHDPNIYENPYEFQPERFLSSSDRQPLVFGMGRRSCVGESLTTMIMFCLITAIVKNFELRPTKDSELIDRTSTHYTNDEVYAIPIKT